MKKLISQVNGGLTLLLIGIVFVVFASTTALAQSPSCGDGGEVIPTDREGTVTITCDVDEYIYKHVRVFDPGNQNAGNYVFKNVSGANITKQPAPFDYSRWVKGIGGPNATPAEGARHWVIGIRISTPGTHRLCTGINPYPDWQCITIKVQQSATTDTSTEDDTPPYQESVCGKKETLVRRNHVNRGVECTASDDGGDIGAGDTVDVKPSDTTARVTWSRIKDSVYILHWFEAYNTDTSWSIPYTWTSDSARNLKALTNYRHTNSCDNWPWNPATWSSTTAYTDGDVVRHNNQRYQAIANSTGVEPGVTAKWEEKWTGPGCTYEPLTVTNFLHKTPQYSGRGSVNFHWGRRSLTIANWQQLSASVEDNKYGRYSPRHSQCTTAAVNVFGILKSPLEDTDDNNNTVHDGAWCWETIPGLKPSTGYTFILERYARTKTYGIGELQGRFMSSFRTDAEALDVLPLTDITPPASVEARVSGSGTVVEGGDAVFTVSASTAPTADLTVTLDVEEVQGTDLNAIAITGLNAITIPAGKISATYTHTTYDDNIDLGGGSVTVTISSGNGYTVSGSQGSASMTITDNDACAPYEASDTALLHVATWQAAKTGKRVWQRQLARALAGLGAAEHDNPMNSAEAYRRAGNRPDVWTVIADEIKKVEDGACSD